MLTTSGRAKLADIYSRAPCLPWDRHADDFLQALNGFLSAELASAFPLSPRRPRQVHVSDASWGHIRLLRVARRRLRSSQFVVDRLFSRLFLCAWREACAGPHITSRAALIRRRLHCGRLVATRGARLVAQVRRRMRALIRKDIASHARACFAETLDPRVLRHWRDFFAAYLSAAVPISHCAPRLRYCMRAHWSQALRPLLNSLVSISPRPSAPPSRNGPVSAEGRSVVNQLTSTCRRCPLSIN